MLIELLLSSTIAFLPERPSPTMPDNRPEYYANNYQPPDYNSPQMQRAIRYAEQTITQDELLRREPYNSGQK